MKKIRNKEQTINKILSAALKIFSEKGYQGATIDDIVAAIGYTKGAFYCHFNSKEELFLAIIDYRVAYQQEVFKSMVEVNTSLRKNIENFLTYMIQITQSENWIPLYIEFLAQSTKNEEVKRKMAKMYNDWREFLIVLIEKFQQAGLVPQALDKNFVAKLIIAIFDGFNIQALVEPVAFDFTQIVNLLESVLLMHAKYDIPVDDSSFTS